MIICCVIITGKSLLQGVKTQAEKLMTKQKKTMQDVGKRQSFEEKEREQEKRKIPEF